MLYEIHRNMFQNKYTARPEHHYSNGKPSNNRAPPNTGNNRPPKSCNRTRYNKSKSMFEKTTKNRPFFSVFYIHPWFGVAPLMLKISTYYAYYDFISRTQNQFSSSRCQLTCFIEYTQQWELLSKHWAVSTVYSRTWRNKLKIPQGTTFISY